jgi:hypothetical protein
MPDEKATKEFEAPPSWAVSMIEGQKRLESNFERLATNVDLLGDSFQTIQVRLDRSERRADDFEDWRARTSERVKGEAKTNMDQDAMQARILVRVENVEKKTDEQNVKLAVIEKNSVEIKQTILDALQSPMAKRVLSGVAAALIAFSAWAAGYFQSKGH